MAVAQRPLLGRPEAVAPLKTKKKWFFF